MALSKDVYPRPVRGAWLNLCKAIKKRGETLLKKKKEILPVGGIINQLMPKSAFLGFLGPALWISGLSIQHLQLCIPNSCSQSHIYIYLIGSVTCFNNDSHKLLKLSPWIIYGSTKYTLNKYALCSLPNSYKEYLILMSTEYQQIMRGASGRLKATIELSVFYSWVKKALMAPKRTSFLLEPQLA